jgi:hypothetical protein
MGTIHNNTLWTYFSIKRTLPPPEFGDVASRQRFQLIIKFLHFTDNTNNANFGGSAALYEIFLVLSLLNDNLKNFFLQLTKSLHYRRAYCLSNICMINYKSNI